MNDGFNEEIIDVATGEVSVSSRPVVIRALALGSCVAVVAYDKINKIGGIAHVMLPGKSLKEEVTERHKYTVGAIDTLLNDMQRLGSDRANIEISLVGGANVLDEGDIPEEVVESVLAYLKAIGMEPKDKIIGGRDYRTVSLEVTSGRISCSEGSSQAEIL